MSLKDDVKLGVSNELSSRCSEECLKIMILRAMGRYDEARDAYNQLIKKMNIYGSGVIAPDIWDRVAELTKIYRKEDEERARTEKLPAWDNEELKDLLKGANPDDFDKIITHYKQTHQPEIEGSQPQTR